MKAKYTKTLIVNTTYKGIKMPLLINKDENNPVYSKLVLSYCKMLDQQGTTFYGLQVKVKYISYLYDYYFTFKPTNKALQRTFIEDFTLAYNKGNKLYFDQIKDKDKQTSIKTFRDFIEYVSIHPHLADEFEKDFVKIIKESFEYIKLINKSTLFHKDIKFKINCNPKKVVKAFPVDRIVELINSCNHIADKIYFLITAFGGTLPCQNLNLLLNDVYVENNRLKVIIAHPEHSLVNGVNRTQYLKKNYKLLPRTKTTNYKYYVGWRNIRFQNPETYSSELIFVGAIENYLIQLHLEYMEWRKQFKHHPYYFCNTKGDPVSLTKMSQKLIDKCNKFDNQKSHFLSLGLCMTGLRHFYGYYVAQVLKLDKILVQRLLGFKYVHNTEKYYVNQENDFNRIELLQGDDND